MGIDLKPIITSSPIKLSDLSDKIIAVDAYNTIYQFLATIRGPTGESLTNNNGDITSHLSGLFYRNINFLSENIKLIYIFDGKPHQLKSKEIEKRMKLKQEAVEKYQVALAEGRLEDARKYSQGKVNLNGKINRTIEKNFRTFRNSYSSSNIRRRGSSIIFNKKWGCFRLWKSRL